MFYYGGLYKFLWVQGKWNGKLLGTARVVFVEEMIF